MTEADRERAVVRLMTEILNYVDRSPYWAGHDEAANAETIGIIEEAMARIIGKARCSALADR